VTGMPNEKGEGFVDYMLWGDDGKPLGLVEAKRTKRDARVGQRPAELYADCLEKRFGQRPIIFYSNGYEHWIWDDLNYPPRSVQGFYKKDELERLIQRRSTRAKLGSAEINDAIVERFYQQRAIRRIGEAFEKDHERKALVVMATGAGKTRTVIALCDLMMRCKWVKRVLFLADRIALVKQSTNAFKKHLASAGAVNALDNPEQIADARVLVSTYPTMLRLIIELQTDECWQDITTEMLEDVRKRLRSLVKFIEKARRPTIYTDFTDAMGYETEVPLPGFDSSHDVERFTDKTQQFLRARENDPVIHKLRFNERLSKEDLDALENMLIEAEAGTRAELKKVRDGSGLGLFVRSMVGLDREAAKRAFDEFLSGKTLTSTQIQFINLVIDYLTQSGWMHAAQLYESPFTDYSPRGVEGLFNPEQVAELVGVLDEIRTRAGVLVVQ